MSMMSNAPNFVNVDFVTSSLFLFLLSSLASIAAHCCPPQPTQQLGGWFHTCLRLLISSICISAQGLHARCTHSRWQGHAWELMAQPSAIERWAFWMNVPASSALLKTILKCIPHHLPEAPTGLEPQLLIKITSSWTHLLLAVLSFYLISHSLIVLPGIVSKINGIRLRTMPLSIYPASSC